MTHIQTQAVGTTLTGRVHSAVRPLPGTILTVTDRAGTQVARGQTGPHGEFQFGGLTPGSYVVIFSRPGYQPHAEVAVPSAVPLDVTLEPATGVHGVVRDHDTGRPVGAATVVAVGPDGDVIASTVSDLDGGYRLAGLDADAIMLVAAAPGADPRATEVTLGQGADHAVDLAVDTYSTLTGAVTVDGRPVADLRLALYTPDGRPVATTVTDRTGGYRFDRLKAGQYVLASVTSGGWTFPVAPDATTVDVTMTAPLLG